MKIILAGWKLAREENETIKSIAEYMSSNRIKANCTSMDCFRHTLTNGDYYIAFGKEAHNALSSFAYVDLDTLFLMPQIKNLSKNRDAAMEKLNVIINTISMKEAEKPKEVFIEREEGTTIGKEACDINITEQEAEYLKTLKQLLGGSKMVVQKGDLRIEVE